MELQEYYIDNPQKFVTERDLIPSTTSVQKEDHAFQKIAILGASPEGHALSRSFSSCDGSAPPDRDNVRKEKIFQQIVPVGIQLVSSKNILFSWMAEKIGVFKELGISEKRYKASVF